MLLVRLVRGRGAGWVETGVRAVTMQHKDIAEPTPPVHRVGDPQVLCP